MQLIQLKQAIIDVLILNFPTIPTRSNDTKEGFDKPTFFTQVIPISSENETINYSSNRALIIIDYFNGDLGEIENLKMYDEIKKAFGMTLKVGRRSFLIRNFRSEIIDEVLQSKFDLDYLVSSDRKKNLEEKEYELMQEIHLDLKRRDD